MKEEIRCGIGFDAHALVPGRKLILGGVEIDHPTGLAGHSDADVLIHAIIDALLGAAGLGDIGQHFPDTDDKYKNISSLRLLTATADKLHAAGWQIGNIDVTVIAQHPRLSGHVEMMKSRLSTAMKLFPEQINIKAKTTERLGFIGRDEGIAAMAVASIKKQAA